MKKDVHLPDSANRFLNLMQNESNQALHRGSIYSAAFGLLGALIMFGGQFIGVPGNFTIPAIWALCGGLYSILIAWLTRKETFSPTAQLLAVVGYVSIPTLLYGIAHFYLPMGAATYVTGPPSYLYLFLIFMTGFMFNERVAAVAGIVAGLQYLLVFFLASPHFSRIICHDPLFMQDLTGGIFYFFKALLMMFTGLAVGVLAFQHKGLIQRVLFEERQRETIDRLFGQYVSPEIKARIMQLQEGSPGERLDSVVLFSDIRSFSTLCERTQPEVVVSLLNNYLERMGPCINRHGGVIDKYIGDAIMATFGAVAPLDNPSQSAVEAGLEMLSALADLNREFTEKGLPGLAIGIGLHRGDVILGAIGSRNRREFTVIGDTVNTASRLESMCKTCNTPLVISESVFSQLPAARQPLFNDLGSFELKGKSEKVPIYGMTSRPPV